MNERVREVIEKTGPFTEWLHKEDPKDSQK
jgi:hypothetical protein